MRVHPTIPPRTFRAGRGGVELAEAARIELEPDEMVTFAGPGGAEYDVVRKSWGYYAAGSTNRRLPAHGLRPLLAANEEGCVFVLLVEAGREPELEDYMRDEAMRRLCWLDGSEPLPWTCTSL